MQSSHNDKGRYQELEDRDGGGRLNKEDHRGDLLRNDNTG
jgi:hypothetical protein